MVRVSSWEVKVFIAMYISAMAMGLVMGQMGVAGGDSVNLTDPPESNITTDSVVIAGEMPVPPAGQDSGYLVYDQSLQNNNVTYMKNRVWLNGSNEPPATGTELLLLPPGEDGSPPAAVEMTVWEDGNITETAQADILNESTNTGLSVGEWDVSFETQKYAQSYVTTDELLIRVKYTIHDRPVTATLLDNLFDLAIGNSLDLVHTVFWIGHTLLWFAVALVELAVNITLIPVQYGVWAVELAMFAWSVPLQIALASSGWVKGILLIPVLTMQLIAVHFMLMLVDIIWIG